MAHKNPVVASADGKKHETLVNGDTIAPGSIPISAESSNGLSVKSDGLFSTAGGEGGGGLDMSGYGLPRVRMGDDITYGETDGRPDGVDGTYIDADWQQASMDKIAEHIAASAADTMYTAFICQTRGQNLYADLVDRSPVHIVIRKFDGEYVIRVNGIQQGYPPLQGTTDQYPVTRGAYYNLMLTMPEAGVYIDDASIISAETYYAWTPLDPRYFEYPMSSAVAIRLANVGNNAITLLPNSDTTAEDGGLFVPPIQTMKRGTSSGNFSFGCPDSKSAKNACGKMGTGVYWKITTSLDNAGAGNVAVIPRVWTNNIPCMEDGTLVPYQFVVDYIESRNNAVPTAAVWFICMGVPTHLMDITDGTVTKLQRADNGLTNGLDDLYPLAPEGEYAQEPQWRREYFYTA